MGRRSREKGKRGEREAAAALREHLGIDAYRGRQYQGSDDSPDVKTSLEGVHFEVKRVERLELHKALAQATEEANGSVPVVLSKRNRGEWLVTCRLSDLAELATSVGSRFALEQERGE